ncbi:hypothetical protein EUGRSUZ_L02657 [Eucalyptus grandis]|uniref:Uncharacterized protein n=1 Tax=Eucalyptus grandis TaxID=71139 RepID=A0AAD9WHT2_EUCGR|nr:hypothetical protein EUGRSUZ_L02657 [Eucalyptus grandis]
MSSFCLHLLVLPTWKKKSYETLWRRNLKEKSGDNLILDIPLHFTLQENLTAYRLLFYFVLHRKLLFHLQFHLQGLASVKPVVSLLKCDFNG